MSQPAAPHTALLFGLAAQLVPHVLQFWISSSLRQAPLQGLKPVSHTMSQPLAPQLAEPFATVGHAVSQARQCAGSLVVSTQEPLQLTVPLGQSVTHLPSEHA